MASPKDNAAARLYTRLHQRDPSAWKAAKAIVSLASSGNPKGLDAWQRLVACHQRNKLLGWGKDTAAHLQVAHRVVDKLDRGDRDAWRTVKAVAMRVLQGDTRYVQAWGTLEQAYAERHGMSVSGSPGPSLSPARVAQLVALAKMAVK
jgi:hypothetical protein